MPSEEIKILEFNQYRKSDKASFIIYADLESLIVKIAGCKNNLEKSSTTKVIKQISSGFSMSAISTFKGKENKHDAYRGKDCMRKLCESLSEHAMKIIYFKNKKIKLLTNKKQELYENAKICYICEEKSEDKYIKDKKYCKVRDHCHYTGKYRGVAHSTCNLKYSVPEEILIVFCNDLTMIIILNLKELAEEFERQLNCLG